MENTVKILLLSAPIGAGHTKAAEAIGRAMPDHDRKVEVQHIDLFTLLPQCLVNVCLKAYIQSLISFPQAYAGAYAWGNDHKAALWGRRVISRFFAKRLRPVLIDFTPDVVICTHATPVGVVGELIQQNKLRASLVSILTDFAVHRLWMHPAVDAYFTANASLTKNLLAYNILPEKIHAFGIPVDNAFQQMYDKKKILKEFHIAAGKKVVLLMGGGAGLLPMRQIVESLSEIETPLCIFMIAGKNKNLYGEMQSLRLNSRHQGIVLGFVENVHELMAVSDLLISKAGGMTASEALCAHLPMLIYQPIPGQEEINVQFLERAGVALRIYDLPSLKTKINEIFRIGCSVLQNMKICAQKAAKPNAAEEIAKYILNNLCK